MVPRKLFSRTEWLPCGNQEGGPPRNFRPLLAWRRPLSDRPQPASSPVTNRGWGVCGVLEQSLSWGSGKVSLSLCLLGGGRATCSLQAPGGGGWGDPQVSEAGARVLGSPLALQPWTLQTLGRAPRFPSQGSVCALALTCPTKRKTRLEPGMRV